MAPKVKNKFLNLIVIAISLTYVNVCASELVVDITNIKSNEGTIRVALWSNDNEFPRGNWTQAQVVDAQTGQLSVKFSNLNASSYAISLFHDENDNEELDTNLFGFPIEGFGFSNNAIGSFEPPSFESSEIMIHSDELKIEISIHY